MFRGRLMWPIRDLTGETIAFGARKLNPDDDGPKYLNTPETQIFKKGHVLYGADLAKREIAKRRQAVIVEGYTDVMACHLSGVPTAVATSGTSFGEDHVKILRRLIMDTDGSDRRGDLHVRRRRGRAEGGAARVHPGGEVRHADLRRRAAGRPRPVRPAAQARRGRRPRPGGAAGAAVRVRDQVGARQARPGHARGPVRRDRRGRADHRAGSRTGRSGSSTPSTSTGGSASWTSGTSWTGSARPPRQCSRSAAATARSPARRRHRKAAASGAPATCAPGRRPGATYDRADPVLPGGAGGAEARGAVAGADRARVRRARRGGVHRARPRRGVRADRRLRRGGHRGPGAGLGGRAARGGARRRGARRS